MAALDSLNRYRDRGSDDRAKLDELLDEVLVGTLSTVVDGLPWSVPLLFARDGDRVLLHGSTGAGMLRHVAAGAPVTLSVHAVDALVLAESAFDHSANYRSAVLRGTLQPVTGEEQGRVLDLLTDRILPGRTGEIRDNTVRELAATRALALPIVAGQWIYKSRSGAAADQANAIDGVWTGVVPIRTVLGEPQPDPWVTAPAPASVDELRRRMDQRH